VPSRAQHRAGHSRHTVCQLGTCGRRRSTEWCGSSRAEQANGGTRARTLPTLASYFDHNIRQRSVCPGNSRAACLQVDDPLAHRSDILRNRSLQPSCHSPPQGAAMTVTENYYRTHCRTDRRCTRTPGPAGQAKHPYLVHHSPGLDRRGPGTLLVPSLGVAVARGIDRISAPRLLGLPSPRERVHRLSRKPITRNLQLNPHSLAFSAYSNNAKSHPGRG
jgi:hypothetical protein